MASKATTPAAVAAQADGHDELRRDLERQGVAHGLAERLARDLAALGGSLTPEARRGAVCGAALASTAQQEQAEALRRSQQDLADIERMMESFTSELKKLDEAVKILTTFVARIRTQSTTDPDRVVH